MFNNISHIYNIERLRRIIDRLNSTHLSIKSVIYSDIHRFSINITACYCPS